MGAGRLDRAARGGGVASRTPVAAGTKGTSGPMLAAGQAQALLMVPLECHGGETWCA
jgi:hypothetical protein